MTNKPLTRDEVLGRLSEHLDDALLARTFPGSDVAEIRRLIAGRPAAQREQVASLSPLPAGPAASRPTPTPGRCRLFTDGASRGNPGQAGAGAVLLSASGEELGTVSTYLGTCTNNVAEYQALLLGLREARRLGCLDLTISLDSELIVRQIQGRYKVKSEVLLPLFNQVRGELAQLRQWSIAHVPRAQNARADELANQGIDDRDD